MTDDTANRNVIGLRRVLRHKIAEEARGVVSYKPSQTVTLCRREPECVCTTSDEVTACVYASRSQVLQRGAVRFIGQPPPPSPSQIAEAIARHERTPRDAFDVFLACADAETVYDFSSETKLDGDRYVITVTATPRKP